jgi:hypothetical protein
MTLVKAEVNDTANQYIEHKQEELGCNKAEALAYIVEESAREWADYEPNA